jgi:NTP pyrophosphatase (non-canonical NTP hydrolase)
MDSISALQQMIIKFRDERDWKQFHNAKDVATSISIEASELLELFLWKKSEDVNRERLAEELADVLIGGLLLAFDQDLNVGQIIADKICKNAEKYPADKVRGKAKKYDEY